MTSQSHPVHSQSHRYWHGRMDNRLMKVAQTRILRRSPAPGATHGHSDTTGYRNTHFTISDIFRLPLIYVFRNFISPATTAAGTWCQCSGLERRRQRRSPRPIGPDAASRRPLLPPRVPHRGPGRGGGHGRMAGPQPPCPAPWRHPFLMFPARTSRGRGEPARLPALSPGAGSHGPEPHKTLKYMTFFTTP